MSNRTGLAKQITSSEWFFFSGGKTYVFKSIFGSVYIKMITITLPIMLWKYKYLFTYTNRTKTYCLQAIYLWTRGLKVFFF